MKNSRHPVDITQLLSSGSKSSVKLISKKERLQFVNEKQKKKTIQPTGTVIRPKSTSSDASITRVNKPEHNEIVAPQSKHKSKFEIVYDAHDDTTLNRIEEDILPHTLKINPLRLGDNLKKKKSKFRYDLDALPVQKNRPKIDKSPNSIDSWKSKPRSEMTQKDWDQFNKESNVSTYKSDVTPIRTWDDDSSLIPPEIVRTLESTMNFKEPTGIQKCSIPNILSDDDFLGVAQTGSGKTLAYVIPILVRSSIEDSIVRHSSSCYSLILCPTRELAQQIEREGNQFSICDFISIVGGKSLEEYNQKINVSRGGKNLVIVATPGRLIDCLDMGLVDLNQLSMLIYDEADRMIDLGFEEQLNQIHSKIGNYEKVQKIMFTATLGNAKMEKLVKSKLNSPNVVKLQSSNDTPNIEQFFKYISGGSNSKTEKLSELKNFLHSNVVKYKKVPIMIFVNYKKTADELLNELIKSHYRVDVIHGSKSQDQRERTLQKIKSREIDILIGTDVAARGIDIPDVAVVINYEVGQKFEEYVHRIGRTGRGGKNGESLTFLCEEELADIFVTSFNKFLKKRYPSSHLHFPKKMFQRYKIEDVSSNNIKQDDYIIY